MLTTTLSFTDIVANTSLYALLCKARVMLFTRDYLQQPSIAFLHRNWIRPKSSIFKDDILLGMVAELIKQYPDEFNEREFFYFGDVKLYDYFTGNTSIKTPGIPLLPRELTLSILTREKFFRQQMSTLIKQQQIEQVLVLGSGLDPISVRKKKFSVENGVVFFEVDSEENLRLKQELIAALRCDTGSNIKYLVHDYTDSNYLNKLAKLGFCFDVPTLVIWGGNSMYLKEENFKLVLSALSEKFLTNTLYVTFDFIHRNAVEPHFAQQFDSTHGGTLLTQMIHGVRLKLKREFTGYDPQSLIETLGKLGFSLTQQILAADYLRSFLDDAPVYSTEIYSYVVMRTRL